MNKLAKKIALYMTIGTIETVSLTGCGMTKTNNDKENMENNISDVALFYIIDNVKMNDKKEFEPYEHLFHVRYDCYPYSGNSISIPDGYEVFEINNIIHKNSSGSSDFGYDIWFTNNKKVQVRAIYNESLNKYDYSNFGTVIEKDNIKENTYQKTKE